MSTLKFDETHNLVAFLKKPTESKGFEQIIDFLNASYVKYALTIQALVDKKKIIITEASIRRDLRFEDEGGVDCLSNEVIFEQLTLMGYEKLSQKLTFYKAFFSPQWKFLIHTILQCMSAKTTAWNEFISTLASAIICLATNQNFNFSKYIFDNMVKHLDGGVKFMMYPRFVQVYLNNQVKGMDMHSALFVISSHTKKVFANIKREGKDFSRKVTPLFATMIIQAHEDMGKELKRKLRASGLKRLRKVRTASRIESSTEASLGHQEDASKQEGMNDSIDQEVEITLVDETQGRMNEEDMFDVNDLDGDEVIMDVTAAIKDSEKAKEGSSKRAGSNLEQKDVKRQRLEKENEYAKLKRCMEIIPEDDDDVKIKATPISSKSTTIVDYKIYKKGKKSYFKIIRADGNSQSYLTFEKMFKNFNREDLEVLWSIVKARFKKTKPIDDMDNLLFQTLKTMFEHHVEDNIWKYPQGHHVDYKVEMAYDLLRLIRKQINEGCIPE
nr:hypothetical protein [Tanacetum cinerariifolium]